MQMDIVPNGRVQVLSCRGSLDLSTVEQFRTALRDVEATATRVVLDAHALEFIDSVGLGALVALKRRLNAAGGDLKLAQCSSDVRAILEVTKLDKHFDVAPDIEHACKQFGKLARRVHA